MAITYPLTPPASFGAARLSFTGVSSTSRNISPFTLQTQQYNWSGQAWMATVECPPMQRADAEDIIAFLLSVQRGTFYFKDYANPNPRGTVTGTLQVSSATANTTTLGISGATGTFAVGDWLSISNSLYKVIIATNSTSVEVFPALRASYGATTPISYTNGEPKGIFRLAESKTDWSIGLASIYGVTFSIMEDVAT